MPKIPQHSTSGKARKPREMTWDAIDKLLEAGCSGVQIAAYFGIHENTLYNACVKDKEMDFVAYRAQKRQSGDTLLLDKLYSMALVNGDKSVAIFLAKNRLGMRDIPKDDTGDQDTDVVIVFKREDNEAE